MSNVFWILFALIVGLPTLELWLLLKVGSLMGFFPAIALILITGALGAEIVRRQGIEALRRIRLASRQGRGMSLQLAEGALLLLAGLCLIMPGLFTDCVGMLLLVPSLRRVLAGRILSHVTFFGGGRRGGEEDFQETTEEDGRWRETDGPSASEMVIDVEPIKASSRPVDGEADGR